jgi:transposase
VLMIAMAAQSRSPADQAGPASPGCSRRWGYDSDAFRHACWERGTGPIIPNAGPPESMAWAGCYVVEQTFALLHQFRRLAVRTASLSYLVAIARCCSSWLKPHSGVTEQAGQLGGRLEFPSRPCRTAPGREGYDGHCPAAIDLADFLGYRPGL